MSTPFPYKNYHIKWIKSAYKAFESLPASEEEKILEKLDMLVHDPMQLDLKKLKGYKTLYRIRSGNYRIVINAVKEERTLYVSAIAHRKNVYNLVKKLSLMFSISSSFGIH